MVSFGRAGLWSGLNVVSYGDAMLVRIAAAVWSPQCSSSDRICRDSWLATLPGAWSPDPHPPAINTAAAIVASANLGSIIAPLPGSVRATYCDVAGTPSHGLLAHVVHLPVVLSS